MTYSMTLPGVVSRHTTERLLELAALLNTNDDDAAGDVLDAVLAELETRMPEADFVAFCAGLEIV
jgi:hypothetical protein